MDLTAEEARFFTELAQELGKVEEYIINRTRTGDDNVSIRVPPKFRIQIVQELRDNGFDATVLYFGGDDATINIAW